MHNYLYHCGILQHMAIQEETSPEDAHSVWPKYGLRESPFTTGPTTLLSSLPIGKVFSGRTEETTKLLRIICSSNNTRTFISGNFGVGKTTFSNYIRWKLCIERQSKAHHVTTSTEIKAQSAWGSKEFLLATLSAVYTSSLIFRWDQHGLKLPALARIGDYVAIGTQKAVQGSIAGTGVGVSSTKSVPGAISPEIYEELLRALSQELLAQGKQLILPYDNLENIDSMHLADFFRMIRDYLQIEGIHFIFMGPPSCLGALETYPQAHSTFSQPIVLGPLNSYHVLEILKKRCNSLTIPEGTYLSPYEETTVTWLYETLNNIRFAFKVLEDTMLSTEQQAPCKITMHEIKAVQEKEKQAIFSTLTQHETKIITILLDVTGKITMTDLAQRTGILPTNLRHPIKDLLDKGLITITTSDKDRRKKYVRISDNTYLRLFYSTSK